MFLSFTYRCQEFLENVVVAICQVVGSKVATVHEENPYRIVEDALLGVEEL
jgi:hypothetical protein